MHPLLYKYQGEDMELEVLGNMIMSGQRYDDVLPFRTGSRLTAWQRFIGVLLFTHAKCPFSFMKINGEYRRERGHVITLMEFGNIASNLRHLRLDSEAVHSQSRWSQVFYHLPDLDTLEIRKATDVVLRSVQHNCKRLSRLTLVDYKLSSQPLQELLDFPQLEVLIFVNLAVCYGSRTSTTLEYSKLRQLAIHDDKKEHASPVEYMDIRIIAPELTQEHIHLSESLKPYVSIDRGTIGSSDENGNAIMVPE